MKIVAVVGTKKVDGVVNTLCNEVLRGAADSGASAYSVNLYDHHIEYCVGCWRCFETDRCRHEDDFEAVYGMVESADVVVLGSPVYIGNVSAIMKNFFDRHNGFAIYNPEDAPDLHRLPFWSKVSRVRSEIKRFGPRDESMRGKGYVLVSASTLQFPYTFLTGQSRLALAAMGAYVRRVGGVVRARIMYTDTLVRFQTGKRQRMMAKAYRAGQKVTQRAHRTFAKSR
ncbi:MAG: flavodoxin family protein [bacterium]|nr:flavodoxin family protein [bacterium]